jgi:hypothetical protein
MGYDAYSRTVTLYATGKEAASTGTFTGSRSTSTYTDAS